MSPSIKNDIELIAEQKLNWDVLSGKTIMISGGTGFIGSFIINVFKYRNKKYHQGIKVVSLSRRGGCSDNTVEYLTHDILYPLSYEKHVDYVLHLASNTHPYQYAKDPVGTITTNVIGCNNLLSFAKEHGVAKFVLASSVEIYGEGSPAPMNESYCGYLDCNNARNGYNEAKRTCEALCQSYKKQYDLDVVIARFARIFGPDEKEDTKAMAQFIKNAINNEDIVLKSKGLQRFSYCYVADAASALIQLVLCGASGEAYNIAADDDGKTLGAYAEYIADLANQKVIYDIQHNDSASKATYALLDTTKIKALGWKPLFEICDAIKHTFLIYKGD